MKPDGVIETCLYARDLEAAEAFYRNVLQLEVKSRERGRHVFFRCGHGMVLVFNPDHTSKESTEVNGSPIPLHGAIGAGHIAFRIQETDREGWREQLDRAGVVVESEVTWPNGGHSIYFRDPAGNSVELVTPNIWGIG
jgi:catechol 2,3-dioxygenase-like lactoylglutathione lyase family enzyme